jgi:hypothetical protein
MRSLHVSLGFSGTVSMQLSHKPSVTSSHQLRTLKVVAHNACSKAYLFSSAEASGRYENPHVPLQSRNLQLQYPGQRRFSKVHRRRRTHNSYVQRIMVDFDTVMIDLYHTAYCMPENACVQY